MTILTNTRDAFARPPRASAGREPAGVAAAAAHWGMIRRFCVGVLAVPAAGIALAAIMALKIAIYLPGLVHH